MLAVFLDQGGGTLKLHTRADKAVCVGCGGPKGSGTFPLGRPSIERGVLKITNDGGSRETFADVLNFAAAKMNERVGRRIRNCAISPQLRGQELGEFDYDGAHQDQLDELKNFCPP